MEKCRLCFTDPKPEMCQHIFNTKFEPPIWKIIEQLSNLIITKNDPYTKNICGQCFIDLVKYSDFRRQILETDYRIQHEKEQLIEKTNDDCDYFEVHFTSTTSNNDDFMIKEEQIKMEDDPLKIDDEIKEELDNSSVAVIDKQNIKEMAIVDGINNNDNITAYYTSPEDNSNETNERQSTDDKFVFIRNATETDGSYTISTNQNDLRLTDNDDIVISDGTEISNKNVPTTSLLLRRLLLPSSKNFNDNSSCTNSNNDNNRNKEESDNSRKKGITSQRSNAEMPERPLKSNIYNKQSSDEANLYPHKKVHADKTCYRCNICNKQFLTKAYSQLHKRIHTGEKPYECTICKKQFTHRASLKNHEPVHTGTFKCTVCSKEFSNKTSLFKHERVHTGEKPFKCNICDKSYSSREHLKEHSNIHTGEKPYCCKICNKMFAFRSSLCRHLKGHRNKNSSGVIFVMNNLYENLI